MCLPRCNFCGGSTAAGAAEYSGILVDSVTGTVVGLLVPVYFYDTSSAKPPRQERALHAL